MIDIEDNPNCPFTQRVFLESGERQAIGQVKVFARRSEGEWCWVSAVEGPQGSFGQAFAQKVEDSGEGTAVLIFGGSWGIRFKPVSLAEEWDLGSGQQWGEPFLVYGDMVDVK